MTWDFPPSCFRRRELWVVVAGERRAVHKDAEQFDLTGLEPETAYTVYMVTGYQGGEVSDRAPLTFTTGREMHLHLHVMCMKDSRGKNKHWLWQSISRTHTTGSSSSC
jgi:hypothetical protein